MAPKGTTRETEPPPAWGEWHKRRRQERKQVDRNRRAAYKTRQCVAIIDLVLHRGEHMVGYKSISRKYRITTPSLRHLEERLFEDDFFHRLGGSSMSWTPAS